MIVIVKPNINTQGVVCMSEFVEKVVLKHGAYMMLEVESCDPNKVR